MNLQTADPAGFTSRTSFAPAIRVLPFFKRSADQVAAPMVGFLAERMAASARRLPLPLR